MPKEKLGTFVRSGAPATKKFDMYKPMFVQNKYIMSIIKPAAILSRFRHRGTVKKIRMEGVEAPFIMICNHNAFYDFHVQCSLLLPYVGVFPAAVDDFIGRETMLRMVGGLPKRKYTADINTVRQCQRAIKKGAVFGVYAEARYSLCGKTELGVIEPSLAQLVKASGVPCVILKFKGHHIVDPFWGNHVHRDVKGVEAEMIQLFTADEVKKATYQEIDQKIRETLAHDDWRWQSENRIEVKYKKRAEGLHKVLYQCPHCHTENKMNSKGDTVFCEHCGKSWYLNYYGELEGSDGVTEFKFPTDWYEWEREQVKKEIVDGNYHFECDCHVNDLPNARGFIRLGNGHLVHDITGFHLNGIRDYDGEPFNMDIDSAMQNAVHIEYNYRFGQHKDCIDLNTIQDTWYVFPDNCEFSLTKISLATEEIYKEVWKKRNEERERKKKEKELQNKEQ